MLAVLENGVRDERPRQREAACVERQQRAAPGSTDKSVAVRSAEGVEGAGRSRSVPDGLAVLRAAQAGFASLSSLWFGSV
jgi:hypothetical protein